MRRLQFHVRLFPVEKSMLAKAAELRGLEIAPFMRDCSMKEARRLLSSAGHAVYGEIERLERVRELTGGKD